MPDSLEERLHLLVEQLRGQRVLLVLDNLEMLLEEGEGTGRIRAGYEGYARLLRRIGETEHQSCLLLTSREKPRDLVPLEGSRSPVRALRLAGLDGRAGTQLLTEKDVVGSPHDRVRLVEVYAGNPLAFKIVAQTIVELFGGEIAPFLEQGEVVFGGVRELLEEQFARLSTLEQSMLFWLAILREPVRLEELLAVLSTPMTPMYVLEALDGLGRRSLIERGQKAGSFTLQSVVLEYTTARLIAQASHEIEQGHLDGLIAYGLCQAQAKEYVREIQERLLVTPLLTQLQSTYRGQADLEARFLWLLDDLRGRDQTVPGVWTGQSGGATADATWGFAWPGSFSSCPAWRVSARCRDARCAAFGSGSPGQRLHRDFRCHHSGCHKQEWAVLGRCQLAGRSARVGRGRPNLASSLAGPHRCCACSCVQPRWTPNCQRELG